MRNENSAIISDQPGRSAFCFAREQGFWGSEQDGLWLCSELGSTRTVGASRGMRGQQLTLHGMSVPVMLSWYWLHRDDGRHEKRFVVSTAPLSATYITRLGRKRWRIECCFKVAKHRFSLHRFGTGNSARCVSPGSFSRFLLTFWRIVLPNASARCCVCDWAKVARFALETLFPAVVVQALVVTIRQVQLLARTLGIDLSIQGCASG